MNNQIIPHKPQQFDLRLWASKYQIQWSFGSPNEFQIETFKNIIYPLDLDDLTNLQAMIQDLYRAQLAQLRKAFQALMDGETIDQRELLIGAGKVTITSAGGGCLAWEAFKTGARFLPAVGVVLGIVGEGIWARRIYKDALPEKRIYTWEGREREAVLKLESVRESIYHAIELAKSNLANRMLARLEGILSNQTSRMMQLRNVADENAQDLGLATSTIEDMRIEHNEAVGQLRRENDEAIADMRVGHERAIDQLRGESEEAINRLNQTHRASIGQLRQENNDLSTEMGLSTNAIFNVRQDQEAAQAQVQQANNELATLRASFNELRRTNENSVAQLAREFRSMQMAMRGNPTDVGVQNLLQERNNLNQEPPLMQDGHGAFNDQNEEFIYVPNMQQPEPGQQQVEALAEMAVGNQAPPQDTLANFYLIDADQ